ncbi:MAG: tRNA glutamyl-Q(34) synthetase GluQRS [Deltaproteobacteria bacterium]|nr:tRNA glutamyl-Q(34) synthetase GluQRS [Deltaproteobacteria bacterium]
MIFPCPDIPERSGKPRGRLAPSPTGLLHLGNAWSFWAAWLHARARGGELVLRLEDIDPARAKAEYAEGIVRDLSWLGLDWDYGPGSRGGAGDGGSFRQSRRGEVYEAALSALRRRGLLYPCYCTRKELREIAGAPHVDDAGAPYPGLCRNLSPEERAAREAAGRRPSLRLACPPEDVWEFYDRVAGPQRMTLAQCGGDFALRRSDGVYAYHLAVVVDDIAMGVTQVVRGNDILPSTPRQLYLYSLFGAAVPEYAHLPLVTDGNGERLAKRHASLTLAALREAGVRPETVLGWLAAASGLREAFAPLHAAEALEAFAARGVRVGELRLPADPVVCFLKEQRGR